MKTIAQTILSLFVVALCQTSGHAQSSWTTPVRIDPFTTQFQNSPLIAVGPQRQIAVACSEGFPGVVLVYRSTDNGSTFIRTQLPPPPVLEYEIKGTEALSFDVDGKLYLLWSWNETPGGIGLRQWLVLSKSTDGGQSFSTFWTNAQRVFLLNQHRMIITPDRNIHILRDTTLGPPSLGNVIYTKFLLGNPASKVEVVLPQPGDTVYTRLQANFIFLRNIMHYTCYGFTSSVSQRKLYYTRSTDEGSTFLPMMVVDSCVPQFGISSVGRLILLGGWLEDVPYLHGVLGARYVSDSSIAFSSLFHVGSKWFDPAGTTIRYHATSSQNYLVYGGVDTQSVTAYYQYDDLQSSPTDSAFFPLLTRPDFALDSLGGKYLVAGHQHEYRLYITRRNVVSTVRGESERPLSAALDQNYPNPFNPVTQIEFTLASRQHVRLIVFDVLGRELIRLVDDVRPAGRYAVPWLAAGVSSGMYFCRLYVGESVIATRKMVLIQ